MSDLKTISGSEEQIWEQIASDFDGQNILQYHVFINEHDRLTELLIDIDLGGGFEGGFEITTLSSPLLSNSSFKFAIHKETFLDEIGKFFGMQDIKTGFDDLDSHVVIKSNDEEIVKQLFSVDAIRDFVLSIKDDFSFGTTQINNAQGLELSVQRGITNLNELKAIYNHFYFILDILDHSSI